jgi:uncharacterized RDD family membrane protein YckC
MQKANLTTRAVAGFIDLLIVIGLARLPDVIGFLAASGYILFRDGLFRTQSVGKRLIGLRIAPADDGPVTATFRESVIRNAPLALAYLLFLVPFAGWVLGPLVVCVEALTALGDDRGMRIGDLTARTWAVQTVTNEAAPAAGSPSSPEQQPSADTAGGTPQSGQA